MGKAVYLGIDDAARKLKKTYLGLDDTAHKLKKVYLGVEDKARMVYSSGTLLTKQIKDLAVGEGFVYLMENDSPVKFYVFAHDYESSLNGSGRTLFARETPVTRGVWANSGSVKNSCGWGDMKSDIYSKIYYYLKNDYLSLFSAETKAQIGTTKYKAYSNLPTYAYSLGGSKYLTSVSSAIFTVSAAEASESVSSSLLSKGYIDGSPLSYDARKQLEKIYSAYSTNIWTRTLSTSSSYSKNDDNYYYSGIYLSGVSSSEWGKFSFGSSYTASYGYLPCFTLPASLYVTEDGFVSEKNIIEDT